MATASGLLEGFHKHHIVPRHLGGGDSEDNLVLLHPYDHAIVHYVRWKIYKTSGDAWAFNALKKWLDEGGITVKGMTHDEETRQKIGKASSLRPRKPHSEETKAKISASKAGKTSNRKGVKLSAEIIQKMRESRVDQQPWNKGLVGKQAAWNKGVSGVVRWNEDAKKLHSERAKKIWAKRKQEAECQLLQ